MASSDRRLAGPSRPTRRERFRQQTLREIKDAAREQIEGSGGAGALSLKAVAHDMGMAGPSLYRYVASRDELLTDVLVEAFTELVVALEHAAGGVSPADRLRSFGRAYRRWALDRPAMYELLFGTPVAGYVAPREATTPLARRALACLITVLAELRHGSDDDGAQRSRAEVVEEEDEDSGPFVLAVQTWARLHGLLSLELRGHLPQLVASPAELYEAEIDLALRLASP